MIMFWYRLRMRSSQVPEAADLVLAATQES